MTETTIGGQQKPAFRNCLHRSVSFLSMLALKIARPLRHVGMARMAIGEISSA